MKFEIDPRMPGLAAADIAYQCKMLAALFGAANPEDLFLDADACCGLMQQFLAMAQAAEKLECLLCPLEVKAA